MSETSSKRSHTEEEQVPTGKKSKKKELGTKPSSRVKGVRVPSHASTWDDIGKRDEVYLADISKELHELIMSKEIFFKEIGKMSTAKLMDLWWSFCTFTGKAIGKLQYLEKDDEHDANERSEYGSNISIITFQLRRTDWMFRELFRRARGMERTADKTEEENAQLRVRMEALSKEKNELQGKLDTWRAGRKDASVSTEPEIPEVVMEEEVAVPTSSIQGIPPNLVGALETIIERKFGELVSRIGLPAEMNREKTPEMTETWAQAVGRKERSAPPSRRNTATTREKEGRVRQAPEQDKARGALPTPPQGESAKTKVAKGGKGKRKAWPTLPKTAAVVVNPLLGGNSSGADFIREAQRQLSLEELGVPPLEIKRSRMGGYILGVSGEDAEKKADRLANELAKLEGASRVMVSRPTKKLDIRVSGLETNASPQEVAEAVAAEGGCRVNEVRQGAVRGARNGMDTLWIQCPAAAAVKIAKRGFIRVGWVRATVVLLKNRPPRCFGCLETGHFRWECPSLTDRSARCYRCGETGHKAHMCSAESTNCPLCKDIEGHDSGHVLGGPGCYVPPRRQDRADGSAVVTPSGVT